MKLDQTDKKIIFMSPPIQNSGPNKSCRAKHQEVFKEIAQHSNAHFVDFTCKGYPKELLRNDTHLNPNGRIMFSALFAKTFSETMGDK